MGLGRTSECVSFSYEAYFLPPPNWQPPTTTLWAQERDQHKITEGNCCGQKLQCSVVCKGVFDEQCEFDVTQLGSSHHPDMSWARKQVKTPETVKAGAKKVRGQEVRDHFQLWHSLVQ